jgi:hypothetical protein
VSAAGKRYMAKVARVPCVLCEHLGLGETPAVVHHLKFGTGACDQQSDFLTIALCPEHHVGRLGIHQLKARGFWRQYNLDELDLLAMTIERVMR